jgi:hypothetical protein
MRNDRYVDYIFELQDMHIGIDSIVREASDPCNNFISNNREGYTFTTVLFIDDPISIFNADEDKYTYSAEDEKLVLNISNYFINEKEKPELQVMPEDGSSDWQTIKNVYINPNSNITLPYEKIAGSRTDENSNYFKWLGKRLKFRVVKTLINNYQTVGNIVAGVIFYPNGLQFTVEHTRRTTCNEKVFIYINLENGEDKGYMNFKTTDRFYWSLKDNQTGLLIGCEMQPIDPPTKYKIIPVKGVPEEDPFIDPNAMEWTLQLYDVDNSDANACERTFTIPAKPDSIQINQRKDIHFINNNWYEVPDANDVYAILDINDPSKEEYFRSPYRILKDGNEVLSLDSIPSSYDELSQNEKDSLDALYEEEFDKMLLKANNPYRVYFDQQLDTWLNNHKYGFPVTDNGARWIKFADDGNFFLYVTSNATAGYIYKVESGNHKINNGVQKTNFVTDYPPAITPDGQTMVYSRAYYTTRSIYKAPLNGNAINNGYMISNSTMVRNNYVSELWGDYYMVFKDISGYGWDMINLRNDSITNIYPDTTRFPASDYHPFLWKNYIYSIDKNRSVRPFDLNTLNPDGTIETFLTTYAMNFNKIHSVNKHGVYCQTAFASELNPSINFSFTNFQHEGENLRYTMFPQDNYNLAHFDVSPDGTYLLKSDASNTNHPYYNYHIFRAELPGNTYYANYQPFNTYYRSGHLAISPQGYYYLFVNIDDNNRIYKQYLEPEEAYRDFYPNLGDAQQWYNNFKTNYKSIWLKKQLGIKLREGIVPDTDIDYELLDADGCSYPFTVHVRVPASPSITYEITKMPSSACAKDGEAVVKYFGGGVPPYIYSTGSLSTIGDSVIVNGLGYGTSKVTFLDAGYRESYSLYIEIGSLFIGITKTETSPQTCLGPNGTLLVKLGNIYGERTIAIKNTDNKQEYSWTGFLNVHTFTGLESGLYDIEVTNAGCTFSDQEEIERKVFRINSIETTDATQINGTGTVSMSFENLTGTLNWISGVPAIFNPSENTPNVSYTDVQPGIYNFIGEHASSGGTCEVSGSFTIQRPVFEVSLNHYETEQECELSVVLSDGNYLLSPYHFSINDPGGDTLFESAENENLSAVISETGNYIVNLHYGTSQQELYTFSYPSPPIQNSVNITPPACPGGMAEVIFSPSGGIDGTDMLISRDGLDFAMANDFGNLKSGVFSYFIKDENSTTGSYGESTVNITRTLINEFKITIPEPEKVNARRVIPIEATCAGMSNGSVSISHLSGGSGLYQYSIDTVIWYDTLNAITGLSAGEYGLYLQDGYNNCPIEQIGSFIIYEPDSLLFEQVIVSQTTCNSNNGSVAVQLTGGILPYTYEWTNFGGEIISTDSIIENLSQSGYYILDVEDANGCLQHLEQEINPSDGPRIDSVAITNTLCYGDNNGTAAIASITEPVPYAPWTLEWSTGETTDNITGLAAGLYSVSVTDTNGCIYTNYFEIGQPQQLAAEIESMVEPTCMGFKDGRIRVNPIGGSAGYTYQWSNGDRTELADSLARGQYTLILSDVNHCSYTQTYNLSEPEMLTIDIGEDLKICPGSAITLDGQDFFTHTWSTPSGVFSVERFIAISKEGEYFLEVADENGCIAKDTLSVTIGNDALKADFLMASEASQGDTVKIYELSNLALDSLNWEFDQAVFNDVTGDDYPFYVLQLESTTTGIYNVGLMAYSGGCFSKATKQIEIVEASDTIIDGDNLGYREPLITSIQVTPNPNDGTFSVRVTLREEADIMVVVFSVDFGSVVDERPAYGQSEYELEYQLSGLNSGVYIVMLKTKEERRQVKMVVE